MLESEQLRVVIFAGAIATVYAVVVVDVARVVLRRIGLTTERERPFAKVRRRAFLALAVLGIACLAYGRFVEPWWPRVTRVEVHSTKLSGASRPLRIVQISDLHSEARARLEEELPDLISELAPDLVIFTGDAAGSGGLPVFRRLMTRLAGAIPVFAVLGNWDGYGAQELYGGTGVHVLESESEAITIAGATIRVVGVSAGEATNAAALVAGATATGDFTVFAYHYSDLVEDLRHPGPDLYLAGHTHGGQVALPFYGALVTLSKFDKRYEAGLYTVGSTTLYVNRGIGMVGGSAPRVRFFARPEITLITLEPTP